MKVKIQRRGFNVYFTADIHYSHKNIVKGESTWGSDEACRNFEDREEMNDTIIKNFNKTIINPNDILVILGDIAFDDKSTEEFLTRLNCKNLYGCYGNHDKPLRMNKSLQSHFRQLSDVGSITVDETMIFVSHYAHRVWPRSHHGTVHLYGHSHNTLLDLPDSRSMDVGVDTNNFFPYSFEDIMERMSKKIFTPMTREKGTKNYHNS